MKDYKNIHIPNHPHARYNGCVREHILIAESILGRYLKEGETVHHIDKNKYNNSIENIMIFKTNSDHAKYHNGGELQKLDDGTFISILNSKKCKNCGGNCDRGADLCIKCYKEQKSKHIPSKELLEKLIWEKPTTHLAKDFGVSDKAIESWCKKYKISKPSRGYWRKNLRK